MPAGGWDPVEGSEPEACENLDADLRTCLIYGELKGTQWAGCADPPTPDIAHAFHPDCIYRKTWTAEGVLDEDGRLIE
jgi:hypothetical protein